MGNIFENLTILYKVILEITQNKITKSINNFYYNYSTKSIRNGKKDKTIKIVSQADLKE